MSFDDMMNQRSSGYNTGLQKANKLVIKTTTSIDWKRGKIIKDIKQGKRSVNVSATTLAIKYINIMFKKVSESITKIQETNGEN